MKVGLKRHQKNTSNKECALSLSFPPSFSFLREASLLPASWLRLISDLWLKPAAGCGYGKVQSICTTPSTLMASLPFGHPHRCFSHQGMMSSQRGGGNTPGKSKLQSFLCRCGATRLNARRTGLNEAGCANWKSLNIHWCAWQMWWFKAPPSPTRKACEEMSSRCKSRSKWRARL